MTSRRGTARLSSAATERLAKLLERVGDVEAARMLASSPTTLAKASDAGALRQETAARLEAELAQLAT